MEEKIRPIHFTPTDGDPWELHQPAFLVGNGINYANGCKLSWATLLVSILPDKTREKLLGFNPGEEVSDDKNKNEELLKEKLAGLTYPEIAELADLHNMDEESTKRKIVNKIKDIEKKTKNDDNNKKSPLNTFVNFCRNNHIPVLTTNFDHNLLSCLGIEKRKASSGTCEMPFWFYTEEENKNPHKISYRYPFRAYFAENEINPDDINNEFAVWYVHGTKRYINSICVNNIDYARNIAEIDKLIRDKEQIENQEWEGKNSWINIFMTNDLVILGLGLDSEETDLRWLLRERYVYLQQKKQKNQETPYTIYIYSKDSNKDKMPVGKEALFKSLGIECVPMKTDDIYKLKYLK